MKIRDVRPVLLTAPYGFEGTHVRQRSACFVEVETDSGLVGVGETYAGVYVPEVAAQLVEVFRPRLVGREALPHDAFRVGAWVSTYYGRTGLPRMVLSAIECALWDVLGKERGLPLHALLGGAVHDTLPLYASGGTPTLGIDALVRQAHDARAQGYRGFKMRAAVFSCEPEAEAERVAAVREALGPDRLLAIDAIQSLNPHPRSEKQTLRLLERLARYDLAWAEEMLPPDDPAAYAALRRASPIPISGGEGLTSAREFARWLDAGAFDLAQPDATIVGGIAEARRVCELAALRGVQIAMHVWGAAPTLMANYHLAFTQPACVLLERPFLGSPLETELLVEPLVVEDGLLRPPTAPGLGVTLGAEIRARYPYVPGSASAFG